MDLRTRCTDHLAVDGDLVAARRRFDVTPVKPFRAFTPTGGRVRFSEHVFHRFADGRIAGVVPRRRPRPRPRRTPRPLTAPGPGRRTPLTRGAPSRALEGGGELATVRA